MTHVFLKDTFFYGRLKQHLKRTKFQPGPTHLLGELVANTSANLKNYFQIFLKIYSARHLIGQFIKNNGHQLPQLVFFWSKKSITLLFF